MRRTLGLWIAALVLVGVAAALYLYDPSAGATRASARGSEEIEAAVGKATTYYEFGHYDRAVEAYRDAIVAGMEDGAGWFEYADALEQTGQPDLGVYVEAYQRLAQQNPSHEYFGRVEAIISESAQNFDYGAAVNGELTAGALVVVQGTVAGVEWGAVATGRDTAFVATRPDNWLGHMGDEVLVDISREHRYPNGQGVVVVGWYEGWCTHADRSGAERDYPCVRAVGVRTVSP